jgi:hypothetical protein
MILVSSDFSSKAESFGEVTVGSAEYSKISWRAVGIGTVEDELDEEDEDEALVVGIEQLMSREWSSISIVEYGSLMQSGVDVRTVIVVKSSWVDNGWSVLNLFTISSSAVE